MIYALIIITVAAIAATVLLFREKGARAAESTRAAVLEQQNSTLADENRRLRAELENNRLKMREDESRFEAIANRVLIANAENISASHRQSLANILTPMKREMDTFRETFIDRMANEAAEHNALAERLRDLALLNQTVSRETRRLTDALKGNSKVQGDWGEMILDNILERSGFRRGQDYTVQETVAGEQGQRLRPDVVISYTEGRKLVIDSKVSIQDYLAMLNADTEECRERHARAHVASVKSHIAELARKSYQDAVGAAKIDFVLMFIPHEGAYLAAMNLDNTLWQTAYDNRVLIISPTHLMSVIKLVEQMWRHEKQNRNAQEIARQAGAMLDKLRGFVDDMDRIDASLNNARAAWNSAFAKLSTGPGNMIARAQKIASLGARSKKELPDRYVDVSGSDDPVEN